MTVVIGSPDRGTVETVTGQADPMKRAVTRAVCPFRTTRSSPARRHRLASSSPQWQAHGWILPDQLLASGHGMSVAHPPHPELVLLCGGTEQQRAKLRRVHSATTHSRTAVT